MKDNFFGCLLMAALLILMIVVDTMPPKRFKLEVAVIEKGCAEHNKTTEVFQWKKGEQDDALHRKDTKR